MMDVMGTDGADGAMVLMVLWCGWCYGTIWGLMVLWGLMVGWMGDPGDGHRGRGRGLEDRGVRGLDGPRVLGPVGPGPATWGGSVMRVDLWRI